MKKCFVFVMLLCLCLCVQAQVDNSRLDFLLRTLNDGGKSDYVMIFAHRGDWRNAPENSLQAYQKCIDAEFDGIEIDVQETKDGEIVIMHDQTIDRTTTGTGKVSDYTLAELKQLFLKSPIGVITRQRIPTLEEVLDLAKGKILIQVDKWQPVGEKVVEVAKRRGCLNQIILRGTKSSEEVYKKYGVLLKSGLIYIPVLVCKGKGDDARLNDFMNNIKTPVISLSFAQDDYPVINRAKEIKERGFRIWYNSLWSTFNGGHDDELAMTNPDDSYGWLLRKGANIIFSDHPFLLDVYLKKISRR